jgi:hypothetical protein
MAPPGRADRESTFSLQQNHAPHRVVIGNVFVLAREDKDRAILSKPIDEISLIPFGDRTVVVRDESGLSQSQSYSLESRPKRDALLRQVLDRSKLWGRALAVRAFRVNMRMKRHALAGVSKKGRLCAFGGVDEDRESLGTILRLTIRDDTMRWSQVLEDWEPKRRRSAALASTKHGLFLFGGKSDSGRGLGELFCYRRVWDIVTIEGDVAPPAGWGYCLVPERSAGTGLLLLTGGIGTFCFYRFLLSSVHPVTGRWEQVAPVVPFAGLVGHATFLCGEGWGIIIGGKTIDKRDNRDVLLFQEWGKTVTKLFCTGLSPLNRKGATFARISNYILCFGGIPNGDCYALDLTDCHWYPVPGDWPAFHSAAAVTVHNVVYVQGGIDRAFRFQSMLFVLSLTDDEREEAIDLEALKARSVAEKILMPVREWDWRMRAKTNAPSLRPSPRPGIIEEEAPPEDEPPEEQM